MHKLQGIGVSEGLAYAKAYLLHEVTMTVRKKEVDDPSSEQARFARAVEQTKEQIVRLRDEAAQHMGEEQAQIFDAHLGMLDDPDWIEQIDSQIALDKVCAEYACQQIGAQLEAMFAEMDDDYMRARAADIADITKRILRNLQGVPENALEHITEPCILVARDLTPSDTARIGAKPVVGMVTCIGGRTSHTAIMARSMGIPAIAGVERALDQIHEGDELILDGGTGELLVQPDASAREAYRKKEQARVAHQSVLAQYKDKDGQTKDGYPVVVEGNIGTPDEAARVLALGGQGIGLFRSEFLFMDREDLPDEEEQFRAYKQVCETMRGKPVTVRTLDIGGDKEVPALGLDKEDNPFLGYRAIRVCLDRTDLFLTQLRALLRAACYGDLRIMFPMICAVEELHAAKRLLEQAKAQLREQGVAFCEQIKIGIMIEIPAAAVCADLLAGEVDFFSVGTNDLIQYACAVDRVNQKVSYLYRPLHPAVLRLIHRAAQAAKAHGIEIGVCGEMAGTPKMAPVLCGLGVTHLSMSASAMLSAKADLARHTRAQCQELAQKLLQATSTAQAEACFAAWHEAQAEAGI